MSGVIVLDTGPLGLVTKRRGIPAADACRQWAAACIQGGASLVVPAIAYYEICRELERIKNVAAIARLDAFCGATPGRYLSITDTAIRRGCLLWAQARNARMTTADPKELDADVLIAAQALDLGVPAANLVVATTNIGHLAQFVTADLWTNITP